MRFAHTRRCPQSHRCGWRMAFAKRTRRSSRHGRPQVKSSWHGRRAPGDIVSSGAKTGSCPSCLQVATISATHGRHCGSIDGFLRETLNVTRLAGLAPAGVDYITTALAPITFAGTCCLKMRNQSGQTVLFTQAERHWFGRPACRQRVPALAGCGATRN
jgi:hypothetical protein